MKGLRFLAFDHVKSIILKLKHLFINIEPMVWQNQKIYLYKHTELIFW